MELECSQCGLVKSLEGFTKAQRRDPDFAVSAVEHARLIGCSLTAHVALH